VWIRQGKYPKVFLPANMPQYAANDSQMQELKGAPKHLVQLSSYL
jgi:hypothetical protein